LSRHRYANIDIWPAFMIEDAKRARARALVRFGFAVLAAGLVLLPCLLPISLWTSGVAVLLLVMGVLCAAIGGGLWAALAATAIGGLGAAYFLEPAGDLGIAHPGDRLLLLLFVAIGVLIGTVFQRARRELGRLRAEAGELERKQAAADDAHRRAAELDALLANAPIGFAIFNPDGRHLYVNRRLTEISGIPAEGLLGRPVRQLVPEVAAYLDPALAHVLATGEAVPTLEMEVATRATGGETRAYICGLYPIREAGGALASVGLVVTDLTERKAIEREREALLTSERAARGEAERASRMKDEFVATLSHELRTPLNAIQGWAQLLRRCSTRPPEKVEHGLDVIDRNARLLAQLISDLLDVSRIVSGKIRLEPGPVALSAVVETALEGLRAAAEAKGVSLSATIGPDESPIIGDAGRLVQVVSNLASNAIKFTPRGGHVELTLSYATDRAILAVTDDGQGIEPEFLPHIFDRFRQADASIARRHGGLGLGLSIVKHLVELHGGAVRAESPGKGGGARFVVELPLPAAGEEPVGASAGLGAAARGSGAILAGIRVLVVEDEPDAQEIALRMLEESGASASGASSAAEALAALESAQPDVLVSDIGLPEVDGYELIRRVRTGAPPPACDVPAVALTAFARPEDRARALGAGFQAHVPKPVEPGILVTTVAKLARRASA
jgi:PAS domain S-box-containing protein